jgi:hypothetical protein
MTNKFISKGALLQSNLDPPPSPANASPDEGIGPMRDIYRPYTAFFKIGRIINNFADFRKGNVRPKLRPTFINKRIDYY